MQILIGTDYYYPSIGGQQIVIQEIAERLVKLEHKVTVVTSKIHSRKVNNHNGVDIKEFDIKGSYVHGIQGKVSDYQNFIRSDFFPNNIPKIKFPLSIEEVLKYRTKNSPIPLIPRVTLNPESSNALKKDLSVWKERRCLIAVKSLNKEILEVAARDGRVDILSIANIDSQKSLTKGIISLARQNDCYLDISLTPIVEFEHFTLGLP